MNRKTIILQLALIILTAMPVVLFSETTEKKAIVTEIVTEIDGATQRRFLLNEIDLHEGKEFNSSEEMIEFLDDAVQDLLNMRIFENAEYAIENTGKDNNALFYKIILVIEDANNTFFIPLAGYSSGSGVKVALKSNFNNIFGTLMNLNISSSINFNYNEAYGRWGVPEWKISPSLSGLNFLGLDFSFYLSQRYGTGTKHNFAGDLEQQYTYHTTSIGLTSTVNLPLRFYYSFGPSLRFNYGIKEIVSHPTEGVDLEFANLDFTHRLGYSDINWIENLRDGFSASISNSLTASYDLDKTPSFATSVTLDYKYFWRINKTFNLSGRLSGSWSNKGIDLGGYLRGVRSGFLDGYLGTAMSIDMTISAIDLEDVLEIQFRPFFDIGIVDVRNAPFDSYEHFAYTTGFDGILYLDKWKSFVLRGTLGIDLSHFSWTDFSKYEIEMTAGLSY